MALSTALMRRRVFPCQSAAHIPIVLFRMLLFIRLRIGLGRSIPALSSISTKLEDENMPPNLERERV